jgi:hypothetical protein
LNYCHIILKEEDDIVRYALLFLLYQKLSMVQWQEMKDHGFVPAAAKGVEHEARNGIWLCTLHHTLFDKHCYYIWWMPEVFF